MVLAGIQMIAVLLSGLAFHGFVVFIAYSGLSNDVQRSHHYRRFWPVTGLAVIATLLISIQVPNWGTVLLHATGIFGLWYGLSKSIKG